MRCPTPDLLDSQAGELWGVPGHPLDSQGPPDAPEPPTGTTLEAIMAALPSNPPGAAAVTESARAHSYI